MGVKEGKRCNEPWVVNATEESQNFTSETKNIRYIISLNLNKKMKLLNKDKKINVSSVFPTPGTNIHLKEITLLLIHFEPESRELS